MSRRVLIGTGIVIGVLLAVSIHLWWQQPSSSQVQKTVLSTIQKEAPASFLVTGTLEMQATVRIDSSQYMTPDWVNYMLGAGESGLLSVFEGHSKAKVQVPGRVSYGFDVRALRADMIQVGPDRVGLDLPKLRLYSVEPDLSRLRVETTTEGWMRVFSSGVPDAVRKRALTEVRKTFRTQARARITSDIQPRLNTARALKRMLRPPLSASGLDNPQFRIQIGEHLVQRPEETEGETFRND